MTRIASTKELAIFWKVSQATRVQIIQFQWDNYKTKLSIPDEPKQEPINPDMEPEPDTELTRDMQKPPHPGAE